MWPRHVIMVDPQFFDVKYAINPHMLDSSGQLKIIDKPLALKQWLELKTTFESLGISVSVFKSVENLPDMVFIANPLFPFLKNQKTHFIRSQMLSSFRTLEVDAVAQIIHQNNHELYDLPDKLNFEGMGDAIWNYETQEIYGGYGFRTHKNAYDALEKITGSPIVRLNLINDAFYHLDTALCIVNSNTAIVVRSAFSEESLEKLQMKFINIIWVNEKEAQSFLAANACSVDGQNIIVEKNAVLLSSQLRKQGFTVHPVDTSEFIKSGGSLFCMKLQTWDAFLKT